MLKGSARQDAFREVRRLVEFTDAAIQRYAVRIRQQAFMNHQLVYEEISVN